MFTDIYASRAAPPAARRSLPASRLAHRFDQGRLAGRSGWSAKGRPTIAELLKVQAMPRPVRQKPSWRPQRVPAHGARLRRVLRQLVPSERRGRAAAARLPERSEFHASTATRRIGLQGLGQGRSDRGPAFRQGRKQVCKDTGPLTKERMVTIDDDITARAVDLSSASIRRQADLHVVNFTHMHLRTHTKPESIGQAGAGRARTTTP